MSNRGARAASLPPEQRVVVTGLGAVTPLGLNVEQTWSALIHGRSGVAPVTAVEVDDLDVKIAAEVKGFDPTAYLDRKESRRLDRYTQLGLVAFEEALRDADLTVEPASAHRVGVTTGSCIGGLETLMEQTANLLQRGPDRVSPFTVPMFLSNMLSGHIAMRCGATGPNYSLSSACATGGHSVGEGAEIIKRGHADVIFAGGSEAAITRLAIAAFDSMRALSRRNDDPQRASRPFDAERDGFVIGEGAGVLVLESLAHARRRGARIHCEVVGYGASADAYHITMPSEGGQGAARAMGLAVERSGLSPNEIGYVNAHATSTPAGDRAETQALKAVFGERAARLPVSSTKGSTGHMLGAGGAVELIFCIKAITDGCLPPTINYQHPDPECDLDYIPNVARPARLSAALSNSFGFGGQNTAVIVQRFEA